MSFTVHTPKYSHAEYKQLAFITAYIVDYDLLDLGSFDDMFEAGWMAAESFLKQYPEGTDFEIDVNRTFDEAIDNFIEEYKNN